MYERINASRVSFSPFPQDRRTPLALIFNPRRSCNSPTEEHFNIPERPDVIFLTNIFVTTNKNGKCSRRTSEIWSYVYVGGCDVRSSYNDKRHLTSSNPQKYPAFHFQKMLREMFRENFWQKKRLCGSHGCVKLLPLSSSRATPYDVFTRS